MTEEEHESNTELDLETISEEELLKDVRELKQDVLILKAIVIELLKYYDDLFIDSLNEDPSDETEIIMDASSFTIQSYASRPYQQNTPNQYS